MKTVKIVVGDASYPEGLNIKIAKEIENKRLVSITTCCFSSIGNHKRDYVVVTLILED